MGNIKVICSDDKTPIIQKTEQYSLFRRMEGNREVTAKRSKAISNSIKKIGLIPVPIVVNENMEVIDGQGRLEALEQLGLPVYYIIVPGLTLQDCISMNINTTPWTNMDYIKSYAETGNQNYQRLLRLIESYDLPSSIAVCAATGVMSSSNAAVVKNGELKLDVDFYEAVDGMLAYAERFVQPMKEHDIGNRSAILMSLCFCYQDEAIDNERMYSSFCRYCHKLTSTTKTLEVLDALTEIYNFGRRNGKVYIKVRYLEYLDGKYPWYASYWGKRAGLIDYEEAS